MMRLGNFVSVHQPTAATMCLNSRMRVYEVRYEDGVLKPKEPLPFPFGEILRVTLVRSPDPKR
jgi:hypothetical protein